MTKVEILKQETLLDRKFNIYGDFENPLFLAKDVAEWIEHSNVTDMISRVDSEEVTKLNLGGLQGECNFLTENGVYEVLMQSRKPIAKQFKKGVKEILTSIRKHGAYMTPQTLEKVMTDPDFTIGLLTALKSEQDARKKLEHEVSLKSEFIEIQAETINELMPDAEYTRKTLKSYDTLTTTQIAKEFGMGAKTLNQKLKLLGIQYRMGGQWVLYAKYQDKGYTKTHTYTEDIGGETRTWHSTVWTEKGRLFIHESIKKLKVAEEA